MNSKKIALSILGVASIVLSKILFVSFNDPEGSNLLIVLVLASVLYILSFVLYTSPLLRLTALPNKLLVILGIMCVVTALLYYFLH